MLYFLKIHQNVSQKGPLFKIFWGGHAPRPHRRQHLHKKNPLSKIKSLPLIILTTTKCNKHALERS